MNFESGIGEGLANPQIKPTTYVVGAILLLVCTIGLVIFNDDDVTSLSDPQALGLMIEGFGPIAVVLLLAVAVVVSPIPSGPVAMAAGALFGTWEGGALTALGAVLGAIIAFGLSRRFGYRPLSASNFSLARWITRPRSELRLALLVLGSRLIPFISFDAVSYVAGLTTMRLRNFAVATTLGVLPASFAFAALGAGMATMDNALLMVAACGVTIIVPACWAITRLVRPVGQESGSKT